MRPLKLTMQAFGSYGNRTVVDFTAPRQNLFLVTGDTGSGKTTIFDAIVFALYGEASSGSNRKDGVELQSQFAAPDCEPYVELRFSEIQGGAAAEYTVRRTPRHIRAKKRGAGEIAVSESVSLILPDGSEYPPKETDQKIEEIVGLSKGQFMQVAMIAQGEFMELLRAKSDDKKLIFRRLFGTELYQKIVDELARRMREKRAEIDRVRMRCQAETARIDVPEDWPRAEKMRALQAQIASASQLSVSDMEALLAELQALVDALKARRDAARATCVAAEAARDAELKALSDAQNLLKFFDQEMAALETLSACAARAEETETCRRLIARIQSALDIQAEYRYCRDADENLRNRQEQLAALKRRMPELSAGLEAAQARAQAARAAQEEALQACARMRERVERALRALKELREIEETAAAQARLAAQADARVADVEARLQDVQARAQEHRRQIEALGDAGAELPCWEARAREAENLFENAKALQKLAEEGVRQRRDADAAQLDYAEKSRAFEEKNRAYEAMRRAFLDAQAGLIAREQLRAGAPCPVCGSLEHPNPCRLDAAHDDLTREALDAADEAASACRTAQERAAAACRSAKDLLREREARLAEALEKLRVEARKHIPDAPEDASTDVLASAISTWRKAVAGTLEGLRRDVKRVEELRGALESAQERREALHAEMEAASKDASAARIEAEKSASQAERMRSAAEFDSERAARDALASAEQACDASKNACDTADQLALKVQREQNHARALAEQLEREMPEQARACEARRAAYEKIMAERQLFEADWMALAERYDSGAKEALQRRVDAFDREKAAAEGARESARNAIGGRARPDLDALEARMRAAERVRSDAQAQLDRLGVCLKIDAEIYRALAPVMRARGETMQAHRRLEALHASLAGKLTGARMDIETYVQRCYLERILRAANHRFREMSAGQFELRMVEIDRAGEGRNHGLDLMVYSSLTGREREVRTLSGGESFMAALSLALGMADQIQESSAAIHLDVMFIDEGFGSLDDHSRDQAVRVLREMAGGSRLVGVISHVTELKQEIEDQLIVKKDEAGSRVRWQIS